MKTWDPWAWKRPVAEMAKRVKCSDMVRNPVHRAAAEGGSDTRARRIADELDAALKAQDMRLDHTATCIAFVEPVPYMKG